MTNAPTDPKPVDRPVEQFFRSVQRPSSAESRFTAQEVAAIVRRDRDIGN